MNTSVVTFNPANFDLSKDAYLGELLQLSESQPLNCQANIKELINKIRQQAANEVVKLNIPSTKDEEWRFTDLSTLQKQNFRLAIKPEISSSILDGFILPEAKNSRLTFVNGIYAAELSDISALPEGVYIGNLGNLPTSLVKKLSKYLAQSKSEDEVFTSLNTSGVSDCAIIWADKNAEIDIPIHLLHIAVRDEYANFAQPRILIVAENNSKLNLIEYYGAFAQGCSDAARQQYYFNNVVTEIYLEENAQINHSRIQRESGDGFHIAKTAVTQHRDSSYSINEISLGGKLYRHNLHIQQEGEQTETNLNGFTMTQGKQLADTHSVVDLTKTYGTVNQLHKYILDDASRGVFNGRVNVPKPAQMTNASQLNRNLLLSPKARINTKPELQITADNVKCAHGATVSQLEADEVFYLRSRGLNEYDARHLLIDAFAGEILDKLPFKSLKQRLTQCVACRTIDN